MATFTESQRNKYIEVTSTPEVEAKTDYKLSLLKEANEYSDLELKLKRKAIFAYLMSEKIVYARDKYDIKKQKENISRLKNLIPKALLESNIREKQKGQGKISMVVLTGKIEHYEKIESLFILDHAHFVLRLRQCCKFGFY